jgi:putative ABC transport system substrate-binding protein
MQRREFITLLGGATVAAAVQLLAPSTARAQQPRKMPTIGFLGGSTAAAFAQNTGAFLQRLRELGWIDGRNIAIEYRWAEGNNDRVAEIAAEFVRLKVDIIHTTGTENSLVAKNATSVIPIVFAVSGNPVGTGLIASLARPGGNVTGLSNQLTDGAGKRVELLREVIPGLRRLAIMAHVFPQSVEEAGEAEAAARSFGIEAIKLELRQRDDIAIGFDALNGRADALYVTNSAFLNAYKLRITAPALGARLPTVFADRSWLEVGGLMSFGTSFPDLFRRSADLVDKILRGTKPADIPVEQPTKFDLVVNLITAKAIGLAIPETFLVRATEVIE